MKIKVSMAGKGSVHLDSLQLASSTGKAATRKPTNGDLNTPNISTLQLAVPEGLPPTQPYFSRPNIEQPYYDVTEPSLRNAPATPTPLIASATLNDNGVPITLVAAVAAASASGQTIRQPVAVVPRLSVSITPTVHIVSTYSANKIPLNFTAEVRTNVPNIKPRLELNLPPGWTVTSPGDDFLLAHVGDTHTSNVSIVPGTVHPDQGDSGSQTIQAYALEPKLGDKAETNLGYRSIGYPGLTTTNVYRAANLRVVGVDLITAPNLNIAYLSGTGDDVPSALEELGARVHILTVADITADKLKAYDAIVLGVRAYAAHPELAGPGSLPLLDYTRHGGVVIVQMNNGRYGNAEAPFPITVANSSGDHAHDVVDESQPVTILAPDAPLLTWPNRITSADFDGWVAERGHSFAGSWAPEFQPLIETHDPGQDPQRGGLLIARAGQGSYIYVGLALFRQLPEGVPGAYRLLANLISASKNPHLHP